MNERIRELAEQSEITQYVAAHNKYLERFAELIVEECIVIMNREIDEKESKEKNRTISDMMDLLEEHFGVSK